MKHLPLIGILLLNASMTFAASDQINPGDQLVIQSKVIGCGEAIWNIETGEVESSGDVVFFGNLVFQVDGKSTEEVGELIAKAIEEKSDHRPSSIRVIKVSTEEPEHYTKIMMQVLEFRHRGCQRDVPPTESPDYYLDLHLLAMYSHKQSFHTDAKSVGAS